MQTLTLQLILFGAFPALMAFAAASDFVSMTISNRLQVMLIALFCVVALLAGLPLLQIGSHFLAFAIVLSVAFFCFARGWIGGGDAKLAACTALWFGFTPQLYTYLLVAACLGGVLTLAILYGRTLSLPRPLSTQAWAVRLHDGKQGIPYGIALAAAALIIYPETALFALALK
jgi:prepilin peptidase CpaA